MALVPKTYEMNIKSAKFYSSSAVVGSKGYNPTVVEYYNAADQLIRVEEIFDGHIYSQTISGSTYSGVWPGGFSYSITYNAWDEATYSG